jgi:hypothetical protein
MARDQQLFRAGGAMRWRKRRKKRSAQHWRSGVRRATRRRPSPGTGHVDLDVEDAAVDGDLPGREERRGWALLGLALAIEYQREILAGDQRDQWTNIAAVSALQGGCDRTAR